MTTGSDDANKDTCIISSSRFFLGRGFTIEISENKGVVAEAASLSFSSRLPQDASRSFSTGEPRRTSRSRTSNMRKSRLTLTWYTRRDTTHATP
jgi:hypothetical protein